MTTKKLDPATGELVRLRDLAWGYEQERNTWKSAHDDLYDRLTHMQAENEQLHEELADARSAHATVAELLREAYEQQPAAPDYVVERTEPIQHLHMRSQETECCWSCAEPWPCPTYERLKPA